MYLLQLHRDAKEPHLTQALKALYALEIPAKDTKKVAYTYGYLAAGPAGRAEDPEGWVEESLAKIGIEVKWI
jgi:hypothetical protein